MRSYPDLEDKWDKKEVEGLKAEPWMFELLKLNPDYTGWGPYEDYMCGKGEGWSSRLLLDSWPELAKGFHLDDLNECVNFYFEISRASKRCEHCEGSGHNPQTKKIADAFYGPGYRGGWVDQITQEEVDFLIEKGRIGLKWDEAKKEMVPEVPRPTAAEVNACNSRSNGLLTSPRGRSGVWSHDAINRVYLIEARAKRLGVWGVCEHCEGEGAIYTEPQAHVNLILWWLHPRKGCSRGIEVKNIQQAELPEVFAFLKSAADRNAERFARVVAKAQG